MKKDENIEKPEKIRKKKDSYIQKGTKNELFDEIVKSYEYDNLIF